MDGDAESLGWIITRLTPLLRSQAAYRLGGTLGEAVDADDVVSEAWLATIPRLTGLEIRGPRATPVLLAYLSTVVRNATNRRLRHFLTHGTVPLEQPEETEDVRDLLRNAMAREEVAEVARHLEDLSPSDREIVILRAVEGLSNGEAAEHLGLDPRIASKRYERALKRLRDRCGDSAFSEIPIEEPN